MNVTRDVIMDLLPLYASGEASADTRALVDEYVRTAPELASYVRAAGAEQLAFPPVALNPDVALHALHRTRLLFAVQRWLFSLGLVFIALAAIFWMLDSQPGMLGGPAYTQIGRLVREHAFWQVFFISGSLTLIPGVVCLVAYFVVRKWVPGAHFRRR